MLDVMCIYFKNVTIAQVSLTDHLVLSFTKPHEAEQRHKPYSSTEQQTRHRKSTQQLGWHVCVAWPDKNIDGGSATIADACNSFLLVLLFIVINIVLPQFIMPRVAP